MARARTPTRPASEGFTSTPIKFDEWEASSSRRNFKDDILSDDDDVFSSLSPIFHGSVDTDEDDRDSIPAGRASFRLVSSPMRCELPRTPSEHTPRSASETPSSASLGPWEMWLLNKMKEEKIKLEFKAEEERLLREKKERQERERREKSIAKEEKILEWLKMKRVKERSEQLCQKTKELEETLRQQEKEKEIEQKAQQKYQDWLRKKQSEEKAKKKREKEEAALREEEEKERRRKAEKKFKEWLTKTNEKERVCPQSPCHHTNPYNKLYPPPSFYNPIPWKPIHVPPPETCVVQMSEKKHQKLRGNQRTPNQRTPTQWNSNQHTSIHRTPNQHTPNQQTSNHWSSSATVRLRNSAVAVHRLQRNRLLPGDTS